MEGAGWCLGRWWGPRPGGVKEGLDVVLGALGWVTEWGLCTGCIQIWEGFSSFRDSGLSDAITSLEGCVWAAAGRPLADLAQGRTLLLPWRLLRQVVEQEWGPTADPQSSLQDFRKVSSGIHMQSTGHPRKLLESAGPEGNPESSPSFQHCQFPSNSSNL